MESVSSGCFGREVWSSCSLKAEIPSGNSFNFKSGECNCIQTDLQFLASLCITAVFFTLLLKYLEWDLNSSLILLRCIFNCWIHPWHPPQDLSAEFSSLLILLLCFISDKCWSVLKEASPHSRVCFPGMHSLTWILWQVVFTVFSRRISCLKNNFYVTFACLW